VQIEKGITGVLKVRPYGQIMAGDRPFIYQLVLGWISILYIPIVKTILCECIGTNKANGFNSIPV
jgi:hypothetical protein